MISAALKKRAQRKVGRPRILNNATPIRVYLDSATLAKALLLGNGNVSAGIRLAVNLVDENTLL